MGKRFVCASLALVLAACGSSSGNKSDGGGGGGGGGDGPGSADAKIFMDAPGPYDCVGDSAPTTANANVTFSGTVSDVALALPPSLSPAAGATVVACTGNCMNANMLASTTTDSNGAFSVGPLATGGMPLDAYLHITYMSDMPMDAYYAEAITMDVSGVPAVTAQSTLIKDFGGCSNVTTDGVAVVVATDCTGTRITQSGVTIIVQQNGATVGGTPKDLGTISSMAEGLFLVCNIPPGTTTIGAMYNGMTFLSHDVNVVAATLVETEVRPGY